MKLSNHLLTLILNISATENKSCHGLKAFSSIKQQIHIWRIPHGAVGWPRGALTWTGWAERSTFYFLSLFLLLQLQLLFLKRKFSLFNLQFNLLLWCWSTIRAARTRARGTGGRRVSGLRTGRFGSNNDRAWYIGPRGGKLRYRILG